MPMSKTRELFGTFFKIGAFTFGGGYAMLPLIERELIAKRKWTEQKEFLDLLTLAQSVPGRSPSTPRYSWLTRSADCAARQRPCWAR